MKALIPLSLSYMTRNRRHIFFAGVGLSAGIATLSFFLALSAGVREKVLNRLYPVNQVEFQVERVGMFGVGVDVPASLDRHVVEAIGGLDGVTAVFPKQRSQFQARLWGGRELFGSTMRVEAFFDGIDPALLRNELRESEVAGLGAEAAGARCDAAGDCGPGSSCVAGSCRRITWFNRFRPTDSVYACSVDEECAPGESCVDGHCFIGCLAAGGTGPCPAGMACRNGACRRTCGPGADSCLAGEICLADGMCSRLSCRLPDAATQMVDDSGKLGGVVTGVMEGTVSGGLPASCPADSYCAAESIDSATGYCEAPIPVLLSPWLLDIYNDVAASALGLQRLSGLEVVIGAQFSMMFGESYFAPDVPRGSRLVRRCRVVGFSPKALDLGVTMPLPDAVRANAAMTGATRAGRYSSVIVETRANEDVPQLVADMKQMGLVLSARSESGRRAANVLSVLTMIFAGVSLVILLVSAINIAHTFGMLVSERRREIAIYRAVGATRSDIRLIVLGEASVLGIGGGIAGDLLGLAGSRLVNLAAHPFLSRIPGSPDDLFCFTPAVLLAGLGCAVVFAIAGAFGPSRAASRVDPTSVLSQD